MMDSIRLLFVVGLMLTAIGADAQIVIGGGVYGGARQADVKGSTFVNVGADHHDVLISYVYGGNDISGSIGYSDDIPADIEDEVTNGITDVENKNNKHYNAFVRVSPEGGVGTANQNSLFIGNLFGGGNGDYDYASPKLEDGITDNPYYQMKSPELDKTYIEIKGGTVCYVYGGGNNATVKKAADICIDDQSKVTTRIPHTLSDEQAVTGANLFLTPGLMEHMGIPALGDNVLRDVYHFSRVFGGNNKAPMHIRPTWHLAEGNIDNLYSGGNEGNMTSPEGLLLEIPENSNIMVNNVFGGCRKADVTPMNDDGSLITDLQAIQLNDERYNFKPGFSARVLVRGGDINNVYGGNDITGNVKGGNAVGVYTSIRGSLYGGGNGSYPYTDNEALKNKLPYSDYYYGDFKTANNYTSSVAALNAYRPNAERVSIRVVGKEDPDDATKITPTVIGGALYVGGNSATLTNSDQSQTVELIIGSHVIADSVFLGNNGEYMVREEVLRQYINTEIAGGSKYNSMDLTNQDQFNEYMIGCGMTIKPTILFDGDPGTPSSSTYKPYSTQFGSFFCGGNVGSMMIPGTIPIAFKHAIVIFDKVVGGCNNAYVSARAGVNANFQGGVVGTESEFLNGFNGNRLVLNFEGLKIQPKRWKVVRDNNYEKVLDADGHVQFEHDEAGNRILEWNTVDSRDYDNATRTFKEVAPVLDRTGEADEDDIARRFAGGNIYGGCCTSGVVNGNVVININSTIVDRHIVFDEVEKDDDGEDKLTYGGSYNISTRRTGVLRDQQGMDVLGAALNVFGGGKGKETEIWGSTTVNLNSGYVFQIFGGSEEGAIGKRKTTTTAGVVTDEQDDYGRYVYEYDAKYSTYVNLSGAADKPGVPKSQDVLVDAHGNPVPEDPILAEAEFLYGGGFEGAVAGDTHINLDNGRIFNSFAGSCNADIQGHTETYVGLNGFPYVRDYIYGGNDLGGEIKGLKNFDSRVRTHGNAKEAMLNASAYIEYQQGRVEKIFGGCYGVYDYRNALYGNYYYKTGADDIGENYPGSPRPGYSKPTMDNAFVNFRPTFENPRNAVEQIYGAGQGNFFETEAEKELMRDQDFMQKRSYILIDIPESMQYFQGMEVFGAGECGGVGMGVAPATAANVETAYQASAVIDLVRGHINSVYGGSYQEGITRRTEVNVPTGSTIYANKLFGGAYGRIDVNTVENQEVETPRIDVPCDVYEANVNYHSADATIDGAIYGGNNACRRTLYGKVNITKPVIGGDHWTNRIIIYGAGYGVNTWSQYTEVNLLDGADVQEAYGGGENGQVINAVSVAKWKTTQTNLYTYLDGYTDNGLAESTPASSNKLHQVDNTRPTYYNTNVHINEGATVERYCYGGGLGHGTIRHSGNVYGTTYIDLLGGVVKADIYAAGTSGSVKDSLGVKKGFTLGETAYPGFIASSTAYIEGGTARNVYGGGWRGSVGQHNGDIKASYTDDILGETHVIIGKVDGTSFVNGIPAVERNAYGGGEGGAVWGTANITLNNGYIGYRYFADNEDDPDTKTINEKYEEKIDDETQKDGLLGTLYDSGCIFGGGYIDNSSVDFTNVKMYGGHVRNALFGGGEIAAIGRGFITASGADMSVRELEGIYKAGKTHIELYDGYVHRNVFGGGRGYNNLGESGELLFSDGYVFGQTEVDIFGGEIGTAKELALGNGNVYGGGDIGYVYSAYENEEGALCVGKKDGNRYDEEKEGYYYKIEGGAYNGLGEYVVPADVPNEGWVKDGDEFVLTEDCKVLVEPHCKVLSSYKVVVKDPETNEDVEETHNVTKVTIDGHDYLPGQYVPTDTLNFLKNKELDKSTWNCLDTKGIIIYNAVFAGGNTASGSTLAYANATSVYGNATASIHDVYHRDLITVGTGHTGGLYGDGNLTFVDGYRGLNITNYGTDYYLIQNTPEISIEKYHALDDREAAYYELRYICVKDCTDKDGTTYHSLSDENSKASTLNADDILTLFVNDDGTLINEGDIPVIYVDPETNKRSPNPVFWKENGVCTIYAGRIMNTIQRADFCGVFGSRMVMQGAQDRVPEVVDYSNYTINRVREVSLNKQHSKINGETALEHGNYFGIYNIVNYLGALSSDVHFRPDEDIRVTENTESKYKTPITIGDDTGDHTYNYGEEGATYYNWKRANVNDRIRNNGSSLNKVALASGVYLELTTEKSTGTELKEKDWGYITGVIELDLINVQTGIGGGFVYAKNVHGIPSYTPKSHSTLTALNKDAITRKDYTYSKTDLVEWETSGNFVHSTQTIIDDCYNVSGKYSGDDAVPAHYWYIQGQVYVYDQYISAYTGAPNAYSETVDIPLTITAASHGSMKLLNVQPNKYAYWKKAPSSGAQGDKLSADQKMVVNDVDYYLNDPISYWDWYLLTPSEQRLFVDETYYVKEDCWIGETPYVAGTVLLYTEYQTIRGNGANPPAVYQKKEVDGNIQNVPVDFDFIFRSSNNLGHDTGYILTYKVNNPTEWSTWYTPKENNDGPKINSESETWKNMTTDEKNKYEDGPTYHLTSGAAQVLGQREYKEGNIISEDVYNTYKDIEDHHGEAITAVVNDEIDPHPQATFESAYIVTRTIDLGTSHLNPGSIVPVSQITSLDNNSIDEAYICTSTIMLSNTEYIYLNTKMTEAEKTAYYDRFKNGNAAEKQIAADIDKYIVPAYYCTDDGWYGGNYYEGGKNYRGLAAWCSMSDKDRKKFTFNYDALDLLIDKNYGGEEGKKYQYDVQYDEENFPTESQASANPAGYSLTTALNYSATYNGTEDLTYIDQNGQSHIIAVDSDDLSREAYEAIPNEQRHYAPIKADDLGFCYVVTKPLQIGNTPYAVGSTTTKEIWDNHKNEVVRVSFDTGDKNTYYFCREEYKVGHLGEGKTVKAVLGDNAGQTKNVNDRVPVGFIISKDDNGEASQHAYGYKSLVNKQQDFAIHGIAPTETSTLFVSRNSDIFDLSKDKIITVIYQYDYEEGDISGNVTPISERHVVNIHIQFKSGVPSVEDIRDPQIVIPGDHLGLREPNVTPGAYEVTGGGWKIFETEGDAESHINGIEYVPSRDPLYWYQDGYYLAYYAKTYLGETYSNHVPLSVANYHDLKKVMDDKTHHYYVDNRNVKRKSKIYINDATDGLNQLKSLYDLSLITPSTTPTGDLAGHSLLDQHVRGCQNLEFVLRTNINQTGTWEPIGETVCFGGNIHGDGYYIDGLDNSLFNSLCGNVYNLGVKGTFTGAGIAETGDGYVENCWVSTTGTPNNVKAVFGNPSRTGETDLIQVVNCYYLGNNAYQPWTDTSHGKATPMNEEAFYNGTVAYDLNGFYLFKRYSDSKNSGTAYNYYKVNAADNSLSGLLTGLYTTEDHAQYSSAGNTSVYSAGGYVEQRFYDGDFLYANGSIPETINERTYTNPTTKEVYYYPIWPDDYIFFGQMLTYGWNEQRPHEEVPSHIYKANDRLSVSDRSNRVYRAPAYYGSKNLSTAHFNPSLNLVAYAKKKNDADVNPHPAYPGMTAIDFYGHQDKTAAMGAFVDNENVTHNEWFYTPLLDCDSLQNVVNRNETQNLLVYAPDANDRKKTYNVLSAYFTEPACVESTYRRVAVPQSQPFGHLVLSTKVAASDHLLVDKQDFNCPIAYTMGDGQRMWRMWYKRTPTNYVTVESGKTKGWEDICLPFTAELVTSPEKGEITHFYEGSTTGHEYWLREFDGINNEIAVSNNELMAEFKLPSKNNGYNKDYTNTYLWDTYYSKNKRQDENDDLFQMYYKDGKTFYDYPLYNAAIPYLIGFPGSTYYEFDLSGTFGNNYEDLHTKDDSQIDAPDAQYIIFVSAKGAHIDVSDEELSSAIAVNGGYEFRSAYATKSLAAGSFMLNNDGSKYLQQGETTTTPFRPYFVPTGFAGTRNGDNPTNTLLIGVASGKLKGTAVDHIDMGEDLSVKTGRKKIVVESQLKKDADVRIVTPAGITLSAFSIEPGEIVETRIESGGVYIVYAANGKYVKKVIVK